MSSIDRSLSGEALHFPLGREAEGFIDGDLVARSGRSARTLVKDGPLRVTLVALGAGGAMATHRAEGPITVHVLSGAVRLRTAKGEWPLETGDLLSLGGGVEHSVESEAGGTFLLTVATPAS